MGPLQGPRGGGEGRGGEETRKRERQEGGRRGEKGERRGERKEERGGEKWGGNAWERGVQIWLHDLHYNTVPPLSSLGALILATWVGSRVSSYSTQQAWPTQVQWNHTPPPRPAGREGRWSLDRQWLPSFRSFLVAHTSSGAWLPAASTNP